MFSKQNLYRAFLVFGALVAVVTCVPIDQVNATANYGPDPDDVGPGGNTMGYAVSNDGYTDITYNHLKIYARGDRIAVFIANSDFCEGNREVAGAVDNYYSGANGIAYGAQATTYSLKNSSGTTVTGTGAKRTSAYCATGDGQTQWSSSGDSTGAGYAQTTLRLVLSHGASTVPGRNDTYQYDLDIAWDANGQCSSATCGLNSYRVKVLNLDTGASTYGSGSNIWVSQDPSAGATQVGLQPGIKPGSNYFDSFWYFAPDCTLNGQTVTKRITIYDDDNYNNAGVQPTANPFSVRIDRKTRYGGSWATMNLAAADISSPAGLDRKTELASYAWELGTAGNQNNIYIDFSVNADYVYRFLINNEWYNNTVQFALPYSNFWAEQYNQCQKQVSPQIDMPTTANVGDTVTATYKINNVSADYYNGYVNHRRYLYWDTGGSTGYETANGDTLINPAGYTWNNGAWNGPITVGSTADVTIGSGSGTARTDSNFKRICAALDLNPDDSNTIVTGTVGWLIKCTDIGKYPSLQATDGDVRNGGSFSPRPNCTVTAAAVSSAYSPFSIIGHDYVPGYDSRAEYGVLSPGLINQFASDTVASGTGDILSFANNAGVSGATYDGLFYGSFALSQTRATHCLSDVYAAGRYATGASTAFTSGVTTSVTPGQSYTYNFTANTQVIQLPAITLGSGQRTVIRVTNTGNFTGGTVRLAGDVKYVITNLTSIYDLPQFVLLVDSSTAVQMDVNNAVTRLDGIYANRGTSTSNFNTCAAFYGTGTLSNGSSCDNLLNVNGAVIARGSLKPYRTAGHNTSAATDPAEIFNLRPDVLLGDYAVTPNGNVTLTTLDHREVAPRY